MSRRAFTLPELMVVISIIVVLVAMLLPSINRAWNAAQLVNCQSNLRQIGMAIAMYENDNKGYLPFANWSWDPTGNPDPLSFSNAPVGWLYASPVTADPSYVQTGVLWPYLNSQKVFRCPVAEPGDMGYITSNDTTNAMTSYLMNGAVSAYGTYAGPLDSVSNLYPAYYFKVTQFNSDDVIMWEAAEQDNSAWNDGSTFPNESYNPGLPQGTHTRHGTHLPLLSVDGHVESMSCSDYWNLASPSTRTRLWCNPITTDGHQQ